MATSITFGADGWRDKVAECWHFAEIFITIEQ